MRASKTIFRPVLALVLLSVVSLGLLVALKLTVKAQGPPAGLLSPAWMDRNIGAAPGLAGSALEETPGVYSVTGAGADIWNNADAFNYLYQPLNGDGQIVARLSGMTGATNEWAKAGVMIRETLDDNSKYAMMLQTPGHGSGFQWRSATGGDSDLTSGSTNLAAPGWIKVVRLGNWLAGYSSPDGINWTLCGWEASDPLPAQVYVGLAVSSHDDHGLSCTVLFDQVSVGPVDTSVALSPMAGTGDGLAAAYYPNRHLFGTPVTNRVDAVVNFDLNQNIYDNFPSYPTNQTDLESACSVVIGMPKAEEFSICWSGEIQAQFTEPYTLYLESDDGARVWLNEKLIIDDWAGHWAQESSATVNLVAGQKYLVRIEYYQYLHQAVAKLRWSSPSTPKCLVPQSQLYSQPTDTDGNGLPDIWQMHYFGHLGVDPKADPDQDGLSNLQEYLRHSDPTNPLNGGVPNEWWQGNIGWQSVGGASYSNGVFAVAGGGYDNWNDEEVYHYVYQPLNGNGQIVARMSGMTGATGEWARVGVMIREALDDHARKAMMFDAVGHGLTFQYRPEPGMGHWIEQPGGTNDLTLPCWVKLVRWNNWVGGYRSPDGTNWTLQAWEGFKELAPQVYAGLVVTSHDPQQSSTGLFEHVSAGPANPAEVLSPAIGTGDGLLGNYYADSCLYGPPVTNEVDALVDFDWLHGEPMGLVNGAAFGVCWSGEIQAQLTEPYTFQLDCQSADWARVWLNGQLIIDTWEQWHPDGELSSGPINLIAGQRYLLRVEFYNNYG